VFSSPFFFTRETEALRATLILLILPFLSLGCFYTSGGRFSSPGPEIHLTGGGEGAGKETRRNRMLQHGIHRSGFIA
jgi:hypothetical protein